MHKGRKYIAMLAEEWAVLEELCSQIDDEHWTLRTDLPAWSVKDILSHVVGTEAFLLGRAAAHEFQPGPHVRNPLGEMNEREVDYRRPRRGAEVLEEFRAITAERLEYLRALSDEQLDESTWTPTGTGTVADLLALRVLDCWVHEQDIRRAVGAPGHLSGEIAEHVYRRMTAGLPKAVAKTAGAPDGSIVAFQVDGVSAGGNIAVGVEGRRGNLLDEPPQSATTRVMVDLVTFICLTCGRWDSERAAREGFLKIDGDQDLGATVAANMNGMF